MAKLFDRTFWPSLAGLALVVAVSTASKPSIAMADDGADLLQGSGAGLPGYTFCLYDIVGADGLTWTCIYDSRQPTSSQTICILNPAGKPGAVGDITNKTCTTVAPSSGGPTTINFEGVA